MPSDAATEDGGDFTLLITRGVRREAARPEVDAADLPRGALSYLADYLERHPDVLGERPLLLIEALVAEIDAALSKQLDLILHAPEFQALEATWRGLFHLVQASDKDLGVKVRVLNIGKRELQRTLRKFRGTAWDDSPIFRKIYEDEYGQFGGEPFGCLVGDYHFDNSPPDVELLGEMAQVSAAIHAPFITAAAPSLLQMDSWNELANPRDLTKIFQTPEYAAWRSLRES